MQEYSAFHKFCVILLRCPTLQRFHRALELSVTQTDTNLFRFFPFLIRCGDISSKLSITYS